MPLENATSISGLNPAWPLGSDPKSQGDDHLRLLKAVLQKTFPAGFDDKPIDVLIPKFATEPEAIEGTITDKILSPATGNAMVRLAIPTGFVMYFAGAAAPDGWLTCNGSPVLAANAALRAFLLAEGSPYGVSGADPLLPDLRGEFIRGLDGGRGVDTGRVLGSAQADQNKAHTHPVASLFTTRVGAGSGGGGTWTANGQAGGTTLPPTQPATGSQGGSEARPRNVALLPCIKA